MIDLESVVIGVGLLLVFICPLIYVQLKQKFNIKKYTEIFQEKARKQQLDISEFDIWNNGYGIGIDKKANVLLYYCSKTGEDVLKKVDLTKVISCRSITERKPIRANSASSKVTQSLTLSLKLKDSNARNIDLEFYNIKYHTELYLELPLIEKWTKIINQALKNK